MLKYEVKYKRLSMINIISDSLTLCVIFIISNTQDEFNVTGGKIKSWTEVWLSSNMTESIQLSSSNSCHRKSSEATALKSTNNKPSVKSGANHTSGQ